MHSIARGGNDGEVVSLKLGGGDWGRMAALVPPARPCRIIGAVTLSTPPRSALPAISKQIKSRMLRQLALRDVRREWQAGGLAAINGSIRRAVRATLILTKSSRHLNRRRWRSGVGLVCFSVGVLGMRAQAGRRSRKMTGNLTYRLAIARRTHRRNGEASSLARQSSPRPEFINSYGRLKC